MRYSQITGVIAALLLIAVCYMPWSYVATKQLLLTGMNTAGTQFGKPGLMNIIMSVVAILFFLVPKIWAKRTNLFICVFSFAWAIRNYILLTSCDGGECPEKRAGIYLLLLLSFVMLIMSFFPKIDVNKTVK